MIDLLVNVGQLGGIQIRQPTPDDIHRVSNTCIIQGKLRESHHLFLLAVERFLALFRLLLKQFATTIDELDKSVLLRVAALFEVFKTETGSSIFNVNSEGLQDLGVIKKEDREFVGKIGPEHAIENPGHRTDFVNLATCLYLHLQGTVEGHHLEPGISPQRFDSTTFLDWNCLGNLDDPITPRHVAAHLANVAGRNSSPNGIPDKRKLCDQEDAHQNPADWIEPLICLS